MSMFLAMQTAIKHNEMKKLVQQQQKEKLTKKKLSEQAKEKKQFDINVLSKGGVTWWKQEYVNKEGKSKTRDVKITVLTQEYQDYINSGGDVDITLIRNGRFSFKDGLGSRIYISCKTYTDAGQFMAEYYGAKKYSISCMSN